MSESRLAPLLARYREGGDLLSLLKEAQSAFGGLTADVVSTLAGALGVPVGDLYGVATFYAFLSPRPVGRHTIRLCHSVPCRLCDCDRLRDAVVERLGIDAGETTPDGRYTLELTGCLGACDKGPAMMIDERRFGEVEVAELGAVLAAFE